MIFFVVDILASVFILLTSNFCSWFFCKSFICFQFSPSISICYILFSPMRALLFWFLVFFLDHFVKVVLVFNSIIQSKFMIYYFFQFDPHSFNFFFIFFKVIFLFSLTLQSKNYSFSLIYFFILIFITILLITIFSSISSFNVWFARNWTLQFFHICSVQSNNKCYPEQTHNFYLFK